MEKFSIQSLPEIIVASHREVIPNYAALGPLCVEKIGPEMQRLGCKCLPPGYCFTIEHNKEYTPTDIDIEYCEQVEEMGHDSAIIQFKRLPAIPRALCMKHMGPYERFYESFTEAFRYIEEHGHRRSLEPRRPRKMAVSDSDSNRVIIRPDRPISFWAVRKSIK